jgi:hypothetical protein
MEDLDKLISEIKYEMFIENFENILIDEVYLFDKIKDLMNKDKYKKLSDELKPQAQEFKNLKPNINKFKSTLDKFKIPKIDNDDAIKILKSKNEDFDKNFKFTQKLLFKSLPKKITSIPGFIFSTSMIITGRAIINKKEENVIIKIKNMVKTIAMKINSLDKNDKNFITWAIVFTIGYVSSTFVWGGLGGLFLSTHMFFGLSIVILGVIYGMLYKYYYDDNPVIDI